jgi:hypothetical protein
VSLARERSALLFASYVSSPPLSAASREKIFIVFIALRENFSSPSSPTREKIFIGVVASRSSSREKFRRLRRTR